MSNQWLLLDVNYLCWRNFHTGGLKNLTFNDIPTGITYGLIRDVLHFMEYHETQNVVFAFDREGSLRKKLYPGYKSSREEKRKQMSPEDAKFHQELMDQINELREVLRTIGFRNVFSAKGYEADDIIASVALNLPEGHRAVIVSGDHDLYQLLSPNVRMWEPKSQKFFTEEQFVAMYNIKPKKWAWVKAIAGCTSDDVIGVDGVGEVIASRFLAGSLSPTAKAMEKIHNGYERAKQNLPLVTLPFKGTPQYRLRKDRIPVDKWNEVLAGLGIKSLRKTPRFVSKGFLDD